MRLPNLYFFTPAFLLSIIGLLLIFSISPQNFNSQLIIFLISIILYFLISQIDFSLLLSISSYLYILQILLLILTLAAGNLIRGSARWIMFGSLSYQASEFIKPILILTLAFLSQKLNLKKFKHLIYYLAAIIFPFILVLIQPDLGSSLIILIIAIYTLFPAKINFKHLIFLFLILLPLIPLFYKNLKPYQKNRIETFLTPQKDPLGANYNQIQAVIAAGSGKILGKGLGKGTQSHLKFLPEKQTDFFFASFSEEFGFVGSMLIMFLFFILLISFLNYSQKSQQKTHKIFFQGIFFLFLTEFTIHIAINIGLMPVTGIPLPFMSVGGSSLLASFLALALASSASFETRNRNTIYLK